MFNNQYTVFTAVSLATLVAACGGVDTTSPTTSGTGGAGTGSAGGTASGMTGSSTGSGPDCMAPEQACGGSCIDTSGDTANCGSCGHSCQGGACVVSRCQPVTIATDQYGAGRIAANSAGVYWGMEPTKTPSNTSVVMYPSAGGPLIPLALGLTNAVVALTEDSKSIYWAEGQHVTTVPVGGGAVTTLVAAMKPVTGIAVDATSLYWAELSVGLNKMPIGGGAPVPLVSVINDNLFYLAVNSSSVFWVETSAMVIKKISLAGGAVTTLASSAHTQELAVDENNVYWVDSMDKQIRSVPVDGGPVALLGTTPYLPMGLAQDAANLYISSFDANGAILKVAKTGGNPQVIASGHGFVQSLAVDASSVYWAGTDWMVLKVAK